MKNLVILFITTSLLLGCEKEINISGIKVTKAIKSNLKLSTIANLEEVRVISLNGHQLFSEINTIYNFNQNLVIHSENPPMISLVNNKGDVINQTKTNADDPFSIQGLTEIKVYNNFIYALDREHFKIYQLDNKLSILSTIKIDFYCQSFAPLGNNNFLLYTGHERTSNNEGMFVHYNASSKKVSKDMLAIHDNTPNFFKFITTNHVLTSHNNEILLWDSTKNTIYSYIDELKEKYFIDYESNSLPVDFYETSSFDNPYEFLTKMRTSNYAFRHFNFKANGTYLNFTYEKDGGFISSLYNLKTGQTFNYKNINEDIITNINIPNLNFFSTLLDDNKFISHIPYEYLSNSNDDNLKTAFLNNQDILILGRFTF